MHSLTFKYQIRDPINNHNLGLYLSTLVIQDHFHANF